MSLHTKKIGLYLDAAGFIADNDKISCILKEEDGELVQQKLTDLDLIDETFIAGDVKPNTSAIYIVRANKRMIVYVTESNILGCVECTSKPEDDPEWTEVIFNGASSIVVHEGSRIAATNAADGAMIFYQDTQGSIRRIFYDEETQQWEEGEPIMLKVAAAPGTPLHVMDAEDGLGIFYLAKDRTICGQIQNYETGKWQEYPVQNARFEDECDNFLVLPEEENGGIEIFVRAGNDLIRINNDGDKIKLGKWEQGNFTPDTTAECGGLIRMLIRLFECGRCKRKRMKRMMHSRLKQYPFEYPYQCEENGYGSESTMRNESERPLSTGSRDEGNGTGGNANGGNANGGNATGGNATGGNATGGNATGGNATGGNGNGGNRYRDNEYRDNGYRDNGYRNNGYGGSGNGGSRYRDNGYEGNRYRNNGYGGNGNGGNRYRDNEYEGNRYRNNGYRGNENGGNGRGGNERGGGGRGGNVTGGNGVGGEARG